MAVLTDEIANKIVENLVNGGLLTADELGDYKKQAKEQGISIITLLHSQSKVPDEELTRATALATGKKYVNLAEAHIDSEVLNKIPYDIASRMMAVPIGVDGDTLQIAALDPDNLQMVDALSSAAKQRIEVITASQKSINSILSQYNLSITDDLTNAADDTKYTLDEAPNAQEVRAITPDSPVSQIIAKLLDYAARQNASDIHIEPTRTELRVRCRIDGILKEVTVLPKSIESAIVSRVKILSNLKIDEHRKPQDGQFTTKVGDVEIDLRIAISPVIWGEQIIIRLLKKEAISLKLEDMGMTGHALRAVRDNMVRTGGMILISGPTGSGKTTTLYAIIKEILSDKINIVTLEDPVEYKIDGVNQIQVDAAVGLTFADGLKSILRQDPDVIMVGEIRDRETAELAVQAALTGHLVLATLHTNSAAGILPRLTDMGIEPFLIASTVNIAVAQRLVRHNVNDREVYEANKNENDSINNTIGQLLPQNEAAMVNAVSDLGYSNLPVYSDKYNLQRGIKTEAAPDGFRGRLGIFEAMNITPEVQDLVVNHSTNIKIEQLAVEQGMITMRQDGYLKALDGSTTIEEVNRVANIIV
ncbi:MAG: GspE/PulE family protein [Candidatus Nomurabacteria bacterium]|jgi:type IV pilus assembly protein PilB|nr:GspE/PulE family protein [Candidatus Nomurabacteria bacterium]